MVASIAWEQTTHGWEFICVKELEKLHSVHVKRVWFILLFKYALQTNIQVTLFIIKGTDQHARFYLFVAFGEVLSLGAMMLGILSELYDMQLHCTAFREVRESVLGCTTGKEDSDVYASHFFLDTGNQKEPQEETLTIADLRSGYMRIRCNTITLVLVAAYAMWVIGYDLLKFFSFGHVLTVVGSVHMVFLSADELTRFVAETCLAD